MPRLRHQCCLLVIALTISSLALGDTPVQPKLSEKNVHARGEFQNARIRFEQEKRGHVAFIGGSITEMNGYRPMVMDILNKRFPETEFKFTAAGISSTCSTTGAYRLADHVLSEGDVDLFFIEFAVNDDQDAGHAAREAMRGMEGLIRHTRQHNPHADIVITYFVNPSMLELCQQGKAPVSIAAHQRVAKHYQVSTIHLAQQVADSISAGTLTWKLFGGTHPKPFGNRIAARMIDSLMERSWTGGAGPRKPHPMPEPIDTMSYFRGRMIDVQAAEIGGGAVVQVPNWKALPGGKRSRYTSDALLCMEGESSHVTLSFSGTAVGAWVLAGPDAAKVQASVDDMPYETVDLFHRFSKGLHYPRTVMFAADLEPGKHRLKLRIAPGGDPGRTAARILKFVAN